MKRKVIAPLLGLALAAAAVTGCSSSKETEKTTAAQTEAKTEAAKKTEKATEEAKTEAVTEAATEKKTEKATEEAKTEAVTEAATEKKTEKATEEAKTEAVTEAATEKKTEKATEEAETEEVTEAVTEKAESRKAETEAVTEAATEKKTEKVTEEAETEAVTEAAAEKKTEKTTEEAETEEVTEAVTEKAESRKAETEAVTEAATEKKTEKVTEKATEKPAVKSTEKAAETVTEEAETEEVTEAAAGEETEETETEAVSEAAGRDSEQTDTLPAKGETFKIGIVQFMDHASLNQIESSLEEELDALAKQTGAVFDYEDYTFNGEGDASNLNQIATQLVSDKVDVIVAIATPAAQVIQAATEDSGIPIVFSAVTDPVGAGLVESNEEPGGMITGTSDALNTETMMNLILANDPDTDKVGLLYSNSEDSSKVPIQEAKEFLEDKGIDVVEKTGTSSDEVSQAVDALIADKVDAIFTPTDNTIMNAELSIYEKLQEAGIPHFAGADSFALNGAFVGFGVNYEDLGAATADMTVKILGGLNPADTPVETFDSGIATINTDTAKALGYDLEKVKEAFAPYCSAIETTKTAENF